MPLLLWFFRQSLAAELNNKYKMKKYFFILLFLAIIVSGFFIISENSQAYTQKEQAGFIQQTAEGTGLQQTEFTGIVATVINIVLGLVGAVFVAFIIRGGVEWITSAGNPEKVSHAKKIIIYAVIGLIIVASAYTISYFVATALEQTPTT